MKIVFSCIFCIKFFIVVLSFEVLLFGLTTLAFFLFVDFNALNVSVSYLSCVYCLAVQCMVNYLLCIALQVLLWKASRCEVVNGTLFSMSYIECCMLGARSLGVANCFACTQASDFLRG